MPELWFVIGLAMGVVVTGFLAVGSFERGAESVGLVPWRLELVARQRAVLARGVEADRRRESDPRSRARNARRSTDAAGQDERASFARVDLVCDRRIRDGERIALAGARTFACTRQPTSPSPRPRT